MFSEIKMLVTFSSYKRDQLPRSGIAVGVRNERTAVTVPLSIVGGVRSIPGVSVHCAEHALLNSVSALSVSVEEVTRRLRVASCGTLARVELVELVVSDVAVWGLDSAAKRVWWVEARDLVVVHLGCGRASTVLDQGGSINHGIAGRVDELVSKVTAVVDYKAGPCVSRVGNVQAVSLERRDVAEGVETGVMTTQTVDDVPRSGWVVETIWINDTTKSDRSVALVDVEMAVHDQVDGVLVEDGLKSRLASCTAVSGSVVWAVTQGNNPWSKGAVDSCKVCAQPSKLRAVWCERSGRVVGVRSVWNVGLGIVGDEMNHAVIVGVPHVADTWVLRGLSGNVAGHAPVVDVAGEVLLTRHAKITGLVQAVGFVVTRADHVRTLGSDWGQLIEKVIEDGLVCFVGLAVGSVAVDEASLSLLQPCVGVGKVTS